VIIEQSEKRAIGSLFRHRFSGRSVIVEDEWIAIPSNTLLA
jgi:hypothetical protein